MIQEKELRIGNLYKTVRNIEITVKGFDTLNKFVVVEAGSTDLDIASKNLASVIFEDLEPIDLDDFKFSRLGFKENMLPLNAAFEKGPHFIWVDEKKQIVLSDGNDGTLGYPMRYVHQFQNIYYLLTGKDINL